MEAEEEVPVERSGTHRTAHIWVHFIKRRDLDKYFNNWRVECRHCREAYDKQTSTDETVPLPAILISTTSKMISHLRSCLYARRVLGNDMPLAPVKLKAAKRSAASIHDDEGSPATAKKRGHAKPAPSRATSLPPTPQHSADADIKLERNDDTPPASTTITYSTAYIWEHYIKRTDLAKYHNNWYVECKHCHHAAASMIPPPPPPPVFVSAMARMKAHLYKCAHISREDLAAFQTKDAEMAPHQPKRRAKAAEPSSHVQALVVRASARSKSDDTESFHLALPVEDQPDGGGDVAVTWLTEKARAMYVPSTQAFVAAADILCRVSLGHAVDAGLYNLTSKATHQIKVALEQDQVEETAAGDAAGGSAGVNSAPPSPGRTPDAAHATDSPIADPPSSNLGHLLEHFTPAPRGLDADVRVVCSHCWGAHLVAPHVVAAPVALAPTHDSLSRHLDSCEAYRRTPSVEEGIPPAVAAPKPPTVHRVEPWPRVVWRHFIKRVDLPRFLSYVQVECRHCHAKRSGPDHTSPGSAAVLVSSPRQMRDHVRTCPSIAGDDQDPDGVVATAALPPSNAAAQTHPDATASPEHPVDEVNSADPVVYAAMEYVAVRCDDGFWLAQLGYDVTASLMDGIAKEEGQVEVTWLHHEKDAGQDWVYGFGHDQHIPVHSIVCSVDLAVLSPHLFTLPRHELLKVQDKLGGHHRR